MKGLEGYSVREGARASLLDNDVEPSWVTFVVAALCFIDSVAKTVMSTNKHPKHNFRCSMVYSRFDWFCRSV